MYKYIYYVSRKQFHTWLSPMAAGLRASLSLHCNISHLENLALLCQMLCYLSIS